MEKNLTVEMLEVGMIVQNTVTGIVGKVIVIDNQGEFVIALIEEPEKEIEQWKFHDVNDLEIIDMRDNDAGVM